MELDGEFAEIIINNFVLEKGPPEGLGIVTSQKIIWKAPLPMTKKNLEEVMEKIRNREMLWL
jgi:hypothetical protein